MAYAAAEAVGCVALIPMRDGIYELSKMAVSPHLRGRGIGRRLLQHAIAQARGLDAKSLFLGSNSRLKNAVHLHESVAFRHVQPESLPPMPIAVPMSSWRCRWGEMRNDSHAAWNLSQHLHATTPVVHYPEVDEQ
jgi:N-acetylglutamate synthase-like GNAT family acetyltransferase